jgi:hypothetical protein
MRPIITLGPMSALTPWIKKISPSKPRKTKSRIRIGAFTHRQMTNKRGIDQIATLNAVSPYTQAVE